MWYRIATVNEAHRPLAGVDVEAIDLTDRTTSQVQTTNRSGEALFSGLTGPQFFRPRVRRTSATVGGRVYTGAVKVQVIGFDTTCTDYMVDPDGGGTHTTIASAVAAAITALASGGSRTIWLCGNITEGSIEVGGLDSGATIIFTAADKRRVRITAPLNEDIFVQSSNGGNTSGGLVFRHIGLTPDGAGSRAVLFVNAVSEIRNLIFEDCDFGGTGFLLRSTGLVALGNVYLQASDCTGSLGGLFLTNGLSGALGPDIVELHNDRLTLTRWWRNDSTGNDPNFCRVQGGLYNIATGLTIVDGDEFYWKDLILLYSGTGAAFTTGAASTNIRDVAFDSIVFRVSQATAYFGEFGSAAINNNNGLFLKNIFGHAGAGLTITATNFINVDTDYWSVHAGNILARGAWTNTYVGPSSGYMGDHGALGGLADDDHTQYHTDARALTWLGTRSTTDLPEGANLYFTNERAQDAVGTILTDSASVDFTYDDAANTITADVLAAGVDHGTLGGLADDDHTQYVLRSILTTRGDLYVRNATVVTRLAVGAAGSIFRSDATDPAWTINPTIAGYMRLGSVAAPTNTTAGDLTIARLFVGDAAAVANVEALVTGDAAVSGSLMVGASVDPTGTGLQIRGATTIAGLTVDSIRLGINGGWPTIVLEDSASVAVWGLRNMAGALQFLETSTAVALTLDLDGNLRNAGYHRVGSTLVPANVTAGDLTCIRLNVGNTAFPAGVEAYIIGETRLEEAAVGTTVLSTLVTGEGWARHTTEAGGLHAWGPGSAAGDVEIDRGGIAVLDLRSSPNSVATQFRIRPTYGTLPLAGQVMVSQTMYGFEGANEEYLQLRALRTTSFDIMSVAGGAGVVRPIRFVLGATVVMQFVTTPGVLIGGYANVAAAVGVPANTTAGDLTCVRLNVGNAAFPAGIEAYIGGDLQVTGFSDHDAAAARVTHSVNQSIPNSAWTTLAFNTERFDNDTIHNNAVNNSRLTANRAGKYLITFNGNFAASATGSRLVQFLVNGGASAIALETREAVSQAGIGTIITLSTVWELAINSYVQVQVWQYSGGGALNLLKTANYSPEFSMVKVSD